MKVDDEMAKTFVEHYNYIEPCDHDINYSFHMESVKEALQAALDAMPKQEPVARYLGEGRIHVYGNKDIEKETILYTHTGIKLQPPREPLRYEDALRVFTAAVDKLLMDKYTYYRFSGDELIHIVRRIEKAHGIGV